MKVRKMPGLLLLFMSVTVVQSLVFVDVDVSKVLQETDEKFVGVTLDSGLIRSNWAYFSFRSKKLQTLASALSPSYLRLGGTDADLCIFDPTLKEAPIWDKSHQDLKSHRLKRDLTNVHKGYTNFTLTAAVWDEVHNFTQTVGWNLIFDLNALYRTDNIWNSSNAEKLLKYTVKKGYKMAGWELSNEPNIYSHLNVGARVTGKQLADDFSKLMEVLKKYPEVVGSILIGPSTTQLDSMGAYEYFQDFISNGGGAVVTNPNFHHYYLDGFTAKLEQFIDPNVLDSLQKIINNGNALSQSFAVGKKVWIGETATAWGGGAVNLSNSFAAAFMWLDKLGLAAKNNISGVLRQSFYGGNYGLVDYYTFDPNPDYWLTLMFKRLVGGKVFQVFTSDTSRKLRFYAHCSSSYYYGAGSVTIYGMNLYPEFISINLAQFGNMDLHVYIMTSPDNQLLSRFVSLNGEILQMLSDTALPNLMKPLVMRGTVFLMPYSYVFIVVPEAKVQHCIP